MLTLVLVLFTSVFFEGVLNRTRSLLSGRQGPGIVQLFRDQWRLLRKGSVYSRTTSVLFQLAPTVNFVAVLVCLLCLPFGGHAGLLSFEGDFIFFAYALALGRFMMVLAALDTGSAFQGMGANREAIYGMLLEPTFFFIMGSFAVLTGHGSFQLIYSNLHFGDPISYLLGLLAGTVLLQVLMAENGRVPVDDPRTHLELTMMHEVMILDHSGFDLGLISITNSIKFGMLGALIANFFIDGNLLWPFAVLIFFATQMVLAVSVGVLESFRARNPMRKNPQYLIALTSLAVLVFFTALILTHRVAV